MDPISAILAGALGARVDSLNLLANNLANASSEGYKADRERFSSYLGADAAEAFAWGESSGQSQMPVLEDRFTDYRQGSLVETGIPTHCALEGQGFFVIESPRGTRYTRAGRFDLGADGELRTREGYLVRVTGKDGSRRLRANPDSTVRLESTGDIVQEGNVLGRVDLVQFSRPDLLRKEEGAYFLAEPGQSEQAATPVLRSGVLESSNVDAASASFRLVETTRQFGLLERAFGVQDGLRRGLIEKVARW